MKAEDLRIEEPCPACTEQFKNDPVGHMNCPKCGNTGKVYRPLSPAELAELVGGDSWVLEKLKRKLQIEVDCLEENLKGKTTQSDVKTKPTKGQKLLWETLCEVYKLIVYIIQKLQSKAPRSSIAKEIKENRDKARAWNELYEHAEKAIVDFDGSIIAEHWRRIKAEMDIFIQEEKDEQG